MTPPKRLFLPLGFWVLVPVYGALVPAALGFAPLQKFVERADELGLQHSSLAGFDEMLPKGGIWDWAQTGVAIGDLDGDGDPDVVFCGGIDKNTILRNDGPMFTDITKPSGIDLREFDRAVALGDYDNDGDLDLYFGAYSVSDSVGQGNNRLYQNDGSSVFSDVTDVAGVRGSGRTLFAQWFDLNRDGLLDLLVSEFQVSPNEYYQNNGDGTFTELGAALGLDWGGSTHVTAILDTDEDGGLDVFVGNDWLATSIVGLPGNLGDGQLAGSPVGGTNSFNDVSPYSGLNVLRGIMGFAFGDLDYDGDFDLYKTDVGENYYFENNGWPASGLAWNERQQFYNIVSGYSPDPAKQGGDTLNSSWGAVFFNADADLMQDFFVVNGHVAGMVAGFSHIGRDEPNDLYWGVAPCTAMVKDDGSAGLADPIDDRGLSIGDMDMDGDLDIFVTATAGAARYYENQLDRKGQGWLQVALETHTSAPGGIGSLVSWTDSLGRVHRRAIGSDGPTASQHQPLAHFGMGMEASADVFVKFPSGIELGPLHTLPSRLLHVVEPELFRLNARVLPMASQAPGVPGGVDRLSVRVFAHDKHGQKLVGTDTVQIDVPGLTPLGAVTHISGNEFLREFALSQVPGAFEVVVTMGGWTPAIVPRVHFRGTPDALATDIAMHPQSMRANLTDTIRIVVSPKDAGGLSLGTGQAVSILVPGFPGTGAVLDLGDGRYETTVQPSGKAGGPIPVVVVNGHIVSSNTPLEIAGAVDQNKTEIQVVVPMPFHAASPNEIRIRVRPRDSQGCRLGPNTKVAMTFTEDQAAGVPFVPNRKSRPGQGSAGVGSQGGAVPTWSRAPITPPLAHRVSQRKGVFEGGQEDGEFYFILEKPEDMPDYTPSGSIVIWIDGVALPAVPYAF